MKRCRCCGSSEHSLLQVKSLPRTRSGTPIYEYQCPLADYRPLYEIDDYYHEDEINIRFVMDVKKYAELIGYREEDLTENFQELYHSALAEKHKAKWEERSIMDAVWNQILKEIWYHHGISIVSDSC